jgi:hypothetical protein
MTVRKRRDNDGYLRGESGFGDSSGLKLRRGKPYEETDPSRDISRNVDKNQDVNGGFSGGIPYGTDK